MNEKLDSFSPGESQPHSPHQAYQHANQQGSLFPFENPLRKRMTPEFFKSIPKLPGVYKMLGENDAVLYVGKAKSLRSRILSYRLARPETVSRKIIRMVHLVRKIEWEECKDETAALLRENELLREIRPPFNVMNTRPESYYLIAVKVIPELGQARFRLTTQSKRQGDWIFGAFKGRHTVREGFSALIRLLWLSHSPNAQAERFSFPPKLTRQLPPPLYSVELPSSWVLPLKRFLHGTSNLLLSLFVDRLLSFEGIPRWVYQLVQADLDQLTAFYETCAQKNHLLRKHHGIRTKMIPQEKLDDLLVLERERQKTLKTAQAPGSKHTDTV